MPPDGFSFEEAMKPAQSAGFSFEDALKPAPAEASASATQPAPDTKFDSAVDPSNAAYSQDAEAGTATSMPAANGAIGRIGSAAVDAFNKTPTILTKAAQDAIDQTGTPVEQSIGRYITNPAIHVADVAHGVVNAGMTGLAQTAMELFGEKGGRDLLAFASSLPMAPEAQQLTAMRANNPEVLPKAPPAAPDQGPTAVAAIGSAPDIDTAIQAAGKAAEAPARPMAEWMQPVSRHAADLEQHLDPLSTGGPDLVPAAEPESVGAAASRDMTNPGAADISISDMKANRRTAEMDQLLQPPQANDTTIYVPNSFPTKAEYSADPEVSQYENLLRQRNPSEFIGEGKRLTENNKARVEAYDALTVPDTTLNTMRADRQARWIAASDDILPNAKPVDLEPVHAWVDEQLSNPRIQENDAVRSVLENFQARLIDSNGDLKTDPAAAWGIHDNIQNQLAKAKDPLNMTGAEKFAEGQLITAKNLIDQALDVATDNKFQSALAQYAEDSKAINAGVLLNEFRPRLTNMSGDLQAANFHRFVVNLAKERGDPGIDPAMDISDDAMRSLINIDLDLKRAGLIKLGGAAGSPTNLLGALATSAGLNAAHSFVSDLPGVGKVMAAVPKAIDQYKLTRDTARHLAAPEGGYVYPNGGAP